MYKAIVVKVDNLSKHPNADKLQLFSYNGIVYIVDNAVSIGDVMILFPGDGKLSYDYCRNNNLFSCSEDNIDPSKKGYFDKHGRVRPIKLRGIVSDGVLMPISSLDYLGNVNLNVGDQFDTINGKMICRKYFTDSTTLQQTGKSKKSNTITNFKEHIDTTYLHRNKDSVELELRNSFVTVIITEKLHGTSARMGLVKSTTPGKSYFFGLIKTKDKVTYEYHNGTRRVDITGKDHRDKYRIEYFEKIKPLLKKGETLYGEIVGFEGLDQKPIMGYYSTKSLDDKELLKKYRGPQHIFSYGCDKYQNPNKLYIYRITQEDANGTVIELSTQQCIARCSELGLKFVPVLKVLHNPTYDEIMQEVNNILCPVRESTLDLKHIMEGVCIRIESSNTINLYKEKTAEFKLLESNFKDSGLADTEESN